MKSARNCSRSWRRGSLELKKPLLDMVASGGIDSLTFAIFNKSVYNSWIGSVHILQHHIIYPVSPTVESINVFGNS